MTVFEAEPCDDSINYIWALNSLPYIAKWAEDPTPAGLVRFVEAWRAGSIRVFFVLEKQQPIGMIHLVRGEDIWEPHIAFDRSGWGKAEAASRTVIQMAGVPLEAWLPAGNRLAIALAQRLGTRLSVIEHDGQTFIHFNLSESEG